MALQIPFSILDPNEGGPLVNTRAFFADTMGVAPGVGYWTFSELVNGIDNDLLTNTSAGWRNIDMADPDRLLRASETGEANNYNQYFGDAYHYYEGGARSFPTLYRINPGNNAPPTIRKCTSNELGNILIAEWPSAQTSPTGANCVTALARIEFAYLQYNGGMDYQVRHVILRWRLDMPLTVDGDSNVLVCNTYLDQIARQTTSTYLIDRVSVNVGFFYWLFPSVFPSAGSNLNLSNWHGRWLSFTTTFNMKSGSAGNCCVQQFSNGNWYWSNSLNPRAGYSQIYKKDQSAAIYSLLMDLSSGGTTYHIRLGWNFYIS